MLLSSLAQCANTLDKHYSFSDSPITKRWIVVKDGALTTTWGFGHPSACFSNNRYRVCQKIYDLALNTLTDVNTLTTQQRKGLIWLKTQAIAWQHEDLEDLCERIIHRCDHQRMNSVDPEAKKYLEDEIEKVRQIVLEPLQARFCDNPVSMGVDQLDQAQMPQVVLLHDRIRIWQRALEAKNLSLAARIGPTLVSPARYLDVALKLAPYLEKGDGPLYDKVVDTLYLGRLGLSRKEFELIPEAMQREIRSRPSETLSVWKRQGGEWYGATGSIRAAMVSLKDEGIDLFYVPPAWGNLNVHIVSNGHRDFRLDLIEDSYISEGSSSVEFTARKLTTRLTQTGQALDRLKRAFSSVQTHTYHQQRRWEQMICDTLFAGREARAMASEILATEPTLNLDIYFAEDADRFRRKVENVGVWFRHHQADQLKVDLRLQEHVVLEKIEKLRWAAIVPGVG